MTPFRSLLVTCIAAATIAAAPASATQDPPEKGGATNLSGVHDFDFLQGSWRVHHKRLKERLANSHEWIEFEGTCTMRPLMDGYGNVDDNVLNMPEGTYKGVGLRAYDPKTGLWAIWWVDSRMPHNPLDPPVKGSFVNGVGNFYSDDTLRGKTIRVRYTWSNITKDSAHWEQAYSPDGGKTWEVNWRMEFVRA
ncbi:MAG TPA: DUF1579 family protein [Rhodanobacteraceae bacterium]|nr:DUF1579 family protein [Rhodanobacteraceae bacterium]